MEIRWQVKRCPPMPYPSAQVRVDAVIALRYLVEAYSDDHLADMKPHLPSLLEHLFRLMSEV